MAETTITGLPNASTPLSGTERVPMDQAGATVDASAQDIANLSGAAITAAVSAHTAAADPHPQYLTSNEGNAAYATAAQGALAATAVQPGGLAAVATSGAYSDLSGRPTIPAAASATPQPLGTAAAGNGTNYARDNHVHAMPSAANVGADPSGTAASAVSAHVAAADPHPGYALESALGTAATLDHGTAAGNLVQLDPTTGKLPAVDGSQLTGLPGGSGTSFAGYTVGNYIVPTTGALAAGQAITANQIALMPFMVARAITVSELAVRVTTAAAATDFQLAVYGSVNGLFSGAPIVSTTSLSAGSAAPVQATITATTLQPGVLYWQAINASGAPVFVSVAANNSYQSSIVGAGTLSEVLSSTGTSFHCRVVTGQTFGTWPDLTGASSVVPTSNQRRVPVFAFLISALP